MLQKSIVFVFALPLLLIQHIFGKQSRLTYTSNAIEKQFHTKVTAIDIGDDKQTRPYVYYFHTTLMVKPDQQEISALANTLHVSNTDIRFLPMHAKQVVLLSTHVMHRIETYCQSQPSHAQQWMK